MFCPGSGTKTSTTVDARLKGSAFILQAAFADINIAKDRPVYSIVEHAFSQTALGKRSSPVGEQLVLIISAHDNFRRLVDLLGG
jgi:hypothetical protein